MDQQNHKDFSQALYQLLAPLSLQYDSHIDAVGQSQDALLTQITNLQQKLRECHDEANSFINIEPYLKRLTQCRRNVEQVNADMRIVRERVAKMIQKAKEKHPSVWKAREETLRQRREREGSLAAQQQGEENTKVAEEASNEEQKVEQSTTEVQEESPVEESTTTAEDEQNETTKAQEEAQ